MLWQDGVSCLKNESANSESRLALTIAPCTYGSCVRRDVGYNPSRNFSLVWNSTLVFPTSAVPVTTAPSSA